MIVPPVIVPLVNDAKTAVKPLINVEKKLVAVAFANTALVAYRLVEVADTKVDEVPFNVLITKVEVVPTVRFCIYAVVVVELPIVALANVELVAVKLVVLAVVIFALVITALVVVELVTVRPAIVARVEKKEFIVPFVE